MNEIICGRRIFVKKKDKKDDNLSGGSPISQWQVTLSDARRKSSESQGLSLRLRIAIRGY